MPSLVRNCWTLSLPHLAGVCRIAGLGGVLAVVGCDGGQPVAVDQTSSAQQEVAEADLTAAEPAAADGAAAASNSEPSAKPDSVPVKIASWDEITAQVTAARRPAVLDVWALSCEPCLEEFPGLVRLHKELGDRVACFSANIEFDGRKTRPPETYREPVEAFLGRVQATMPSFISSTPSDEIYTAADIDSIPAVIVYAADGSIAKKFVDAGEMAGFTYDKDVIPLVRQLLAKDQTP